MKEAPPSIERETAIEIPKERYDIVNVLTPQGEWVKAQKIQEEGNRITVRWNDQESEKGHVVRTVFREIFEGWQQNCPKNT